MHTGYWIRILSLYRRKKASKRHKVYFSHTDKYVYRNRSYRTTRPRSRSEEAMVRKHNRPFAILNNLALFSDNAHRSYDIRQPFSRSTVHSGDSSTDTGACVESKERFAFCSRLSRRLCHLLFILLIMLSYSYITGAA